MVPLSLSSPVLLYFPSSPVTQAATVVSRAKVCYRAELGRQAGRLGKARRWMGPGHWEGEEVGPGSNANTSLVVGWGGEASIFGGL